MRLRFNKHNASLEHVTQTPGAYCLPRDRLLAYRTWTWGGIVLDMKVWIGNGCSDDVTAAAASSTTTKDSMKVASERRRKP
mmetsp:Transcript_7671/g.15443  ORF Transcript_7671/g.15443 Transcript_7671/m.15443 type:complete len:81 (+) Transcript_7671:1464-1706(+)